MGKVRGRTRQRRTGSGVRSKEDGAARHRGSGTDHGWRGNKGRGLKEEDEVLGARKKIMGIQ
jgi:hypothetical protein